MPLGWLARSVNDGLMVTELVERVDTEDRVLDIVERGQAIRNGWLHRVSTTICRDERGRVLVYRRPGDLSRFPGYHDVCFGGAVGVGESYEAAAGRELSEELGVEVDVRPVLTFLCDGEISSYWLGVHEALLSGEVEPDPDEIACVAWMTLDELARAVQQHRFIPDGQEAFARYLAVTGSSSRETCMTDGSGM
jgi:isopentenyldiphosphate isomerase